MITIRKSAERGHFDHGWLNTFHTFSFDQYLDRRYMGFRSLRVINEDFVAPGRGFPTHGHRDMEIITYILEGALKHQDSMGNGSVIRPGDVQRMTAGTGVQHSEQNASDTDAVHLLQIWILPAEKNLTPGYEQKTFSIEERQGQFRLVASPNGDEGSVMIHQDARVFASILGTGEDINFKMESLRYAWVQVARGSINVNGDRADQGDGCVVVGESELKIVANEAAELLLFDLQ